VWYEATAENGILREKMILLHGERVGFECRAVACSEAGIAYAGRDSEDGDLESKHAKRPRGFIYGAVRGSED
jgi:hypothetical protein